MTSTRPSFDERLDKHPHLRERFESILAIVEDTAGTIDLADEAERLAIIEVRQLGADTLHEWARTKESQKSTEMGATDNNAIRNGKKKTPLEHNIRRNRLGGTDFFGTRSPSSSIFAECTSEELRLLISTSALPY